VRAFQRALSDLGLGGRIIAADPSESAPILYLADAALLTPTSEDPDYPGVRLEFCERQGVGLVIPLADEDLEGRARRAAA
jgi:carbamoyl-phosphate synthase large subunit